MRVAGRSPAASPCPTATTTRTLTRSSPRAPSSVGLNGGTDITDYDPRPLPSSELITTPANWTHWQVTSYFQQVPYRGAFPASSKGDGLWIDGWTNWDPQNTVYDPVATDVVEAEVASTRMLKQNHPNPFNPVTTIAYSVRETGAVTIEVYDVSGKVVRTLLDTDVEAGASGSVTWNGTNDRGEQCASGVYFYGIRSAGETETRKMVMLK